MSLSAQYIADLPSRGLWDRFLEIVDSVSGEEWTIISHEPVLPDFSTWEAPLSVLPKRTRKRHGSRGAKRRRGPVSASASAGASVSS